MAKVILFPLLRGPLSHAAVQAPKASLEMQCTSPLSFRLYYRALLGSSEQHNKMSISSLVFEGTFWFSSCDLVCCDYQKGNFKYSKGGKKTGVVSSRKACWAFGM